MDREQYKEYGGSYDDLSNITAYDDISRLQEIQEEEKKNENSKLSFAGMMALIAGGLLMAISLGGFFSGLSIVEFLTGALTVIGSGALGYGFYKLLKLVFRRKELSFPTINVYRKTQPQTTDTQRKKQMTDTTDYTTRRTYRKEKYPLNTEKKELKRSKTSRVFSGVAGGLAEFFGLPVQLIRFAFFVSLFPTSGFSFFIYLLLSIVLPQDYESYRESTYKGDRDNFLRDS